MLENVSGKPLLRWAWETLSGAPGVSEVLIATDDSRVETWARAQGMRVVKTSAECRNGTERTAEIARMIRADYYVNVQADQVALESRVVTAMLRAAKAHPEWEIATVGTRWYRTGCLE
ncbi:MAG TPA: NTP transferase domain-containing protein, partial [Candidatus Latescibacteria bacterium]|nr:NTP transferase domain-containing protein [Candidatus Latescibacterota bacterium]